MGCGASQEFYIETVHVADTESGYPPPQPPTGRRDTVFEEGYWIIIETHAKGAPRSVAKSYSDLVSYVTKGCETDVQKVRALYCWLAAQKMDAMKLDKVRDGHCPEGYMKTIQQGNGNHVYFFALLCRAAGIPCVILHGEGKSKEYEVGDQDMSDLSSAWNAVHVQGSWRLVHIFWALVGVAGFQKGGWTKVEEDGRAVRQRQQRSEGQTVQRQDDFWFLTDPDQFVYFCRARDVQWQLLKSPWSVEKFVNVPYFSQHYFDSGFKLTSKHAAILKSDRGTCDITFQHADDLDADPLDYTLLFNEQESDGKLDQALQLERYVLQNNGLTEKSLQVRFPVKGIYKVKVTGSALYRSLLASFRLESHEVLKDVQPYPINPKIGFGFGKKAEAVGLAKPSQTKGIMVVQQGEIIRFQFVCRTRLELQALLVHKDRAAEELSAYVKQHRGGDDVTVTVTVPEHARNPEYALQVNARPEGSGGEFDNVVNYLLTHGRQEVEQSGEQNDKTGTREERDKVREELRASINSRDINRLEAVLTQCLQMNLEDHGDITEAKQVLLALHIEALQAAIKARDLDQLDEAVGAARDSHVYPRLQGSSELSDAVALRDRLRRLHRYLPDILALKQPTVSEIHRYSRPLPPVHEVMQATYLLLGEREKDLKRWDFIRTLLRKTGQDGIIRRIKTFDLQHIKPRRVKAAEGYLSTCDLDSARLVSAGAGTFYNWSYNTITVGREEEKATT